MSRRGPGGPRRGGPGRRPAPLPPRAEAKPAPAPDGSCNALCSYFKCLNNALVVVRRPSHGRMQRTAYCRWIGDECIAGSCQYASCNLKALLPDGGCLYVKEKRVERPEKTLEEIEAELKREEAEMSKIERLMRRRGYEAEEELL